MGFLFKMLHTRRSCAIFGDHVVKFKVELEQMLTSEVRKQKPEISHVSVSFDGQFAIYNEDARYTLAGSLLPQNSFSTPVMRSA